MSTITQNSVVEIQNLVIIHESWPIKPNPRIIEIALLFLLSSFYFKDKSYEFENS